jgi:acyl transferase domain-containing protein
VTCGCRFGAFLPDVASFDTLLLGMSMAEAVLVDPQQRLLLEAAAEVLLTASAGSSSSGLQQQGFAGSSTGVYLGIASSDYGSLVRSFTPAGAYHATANALSVAAGRLSYTFALSGPAVSVDTACSASLVALHMAKSGIAELVEAAGSAAPAAALVGGVHVQATSTSTSYVWVAGMLSPSGRCQVLDAAADGYVRGEAVHVLLVSSAALAASAMQQPEAIILGSAINQDGRSSSLTAPNGPAQQEVLRAALTDAGLAPTAAHLLSLHGTGTPLGKLHGGGE